MPQEVVAAMAGLLGVLMGPVIAQIVERLPHDRPLSMFDCPNCSAPLSPATHLPLIGGILGGGRCPSCSTSLRRRVVIDVVSAVSFGLIAWRFGLTPKTLVYLWYAALLTGVFAIDLEHRLILNRMIYPAIIAAPATALMSGISLPASLLGGLTGFGILFGMYLLGEVLFGPNRGALGFGDVKLGLFIGLIVGIHSILPAILTFSLVGGAVSALLLLTRMKGLRDHIPFGPFMIVGAAWALWLM